MALNYTDHINNLVLAGVMTEKQFFESEIKNWKASKTRKHQITGEEYYRGKHDILTRKRTVIGKDGKLQEVDNLPNNKIITNRPELCIELLNFSEIALIASSGAFPNIIF